MQPPQTKTRAPDQNGIPEAEEAQACLYRSDMICGGSAAIERAQGFFYLGLLNDARAHALARERKGFAGFRI